MKHPEHPKDSDIAILAEINNIHGIQGQVKLRVFTESVDNFLDYLKNKQLYWNFNKDNNNWDECLIKPKSVKVINNNSLIASINNCSDRDIAREYQFTKVGILKSDLPKLDNSSNEYYWSD